MTELHHVDLASSHLGYEYHAGRRTLGTVTLGHGYPHNIITDRLAGISAPVLVLRGAQDVVVPPEAQQATALGLSYCKEVVFSRQGPMLPLEAPAMTA